MDVFLSWSKRPSQQYAEVFHKYLPLTLQHVQTFMSSHSIENGELGTPRIFDTLSETGIGVLFMTPNNISEEWLNFEAGALFKGQQTNRVMPLIFDGDKKLLSGPIGSLQACEFNRDNVLDIIKTINNHSGEDKKEESFVERSFELTWPQIEEEIGKVSNESTYSEEELEIDSMDLKFQQILEMLNEINDTQKAANRSRIKTLKSGGAKKVLLIFETLLDTFKKRKIIPIIYIR